ncbi:MAG TPA: hypothetical protein VH951_12470, partial [Dehalococcoidia bacterium]
QLATAGVIGWGIAILAFMTAVTIYGYMHVNQRGADRIPVTVQGWYSLVGGPPARIAITDLTTVGAGFESETPLAAGTRIAMALAGGVEFDAEVRRCSTLPGGHYGIGVQSFANSRTQAEITRVIARSLFEPDMEPEAEVAAERTAA